MIKFLSNTWASLYVGMSTSKATQMVSYTVPRPESSKSLVSFKKRAIKKRKFCLKHISSQIKSFMFYDIELHGFIKSLVQVTESIQRQLAEFKFSGCCKA